MSEMKKGSSLSDEEMLKMLKEEIDRHGLADLPSRTKLEKVYDKTKMPHPNSYKQRFGTWQNALRQIGINYNGRSISSEVAKEHNKGKRYASSWSDLTREEVIDAIFAEINRKGIRKSIEYQERRDKDSSSSIPTVSYLYGLKWSDINSLYIERYGRSMEERNSLEKNNKKWKYMSNEEIIDIVTDEMIRINAVKYTDYTKNRNQNNTPSVTSLFNRGMSWKEVKDSYYKKI